MPPAPNPALRRRLAAWRGSALSFKAVSFALVGAVNTLVDLAVFLLVYGKAGLGLVPANLVSWLVAVSGSYVMNSYTTFAAESGRKLRWRSYLTFVLSGIVGAAGNTATLVVASYFLPVLGAKLCAIGASFVINFSLSHFVVFRRREG